MKLCVNLVWPSKIIHFVMFDAKFLKGNFWEEKSKTLVWKLKLNIMCFEKILESFSRVTCHQKYFKNWFCRKISSFSKNSIFFSLDRSSVIFDQSKISRFFKCRFCLTRLVFDRCSTDWNWKIFSFQVFDQIFFHASFMFRIHVHCIVFCIHLTVLQSNLSLFSHITCIHFAKLSTQLDLKIGWLIFESLIHFSTCYFLCVNYRKYFS